MEEATDVVLSKISLRDLSGLSDSFFEEGTPTNISQVLDEAKWRLSHLKEQFNSFKLDPLFETFTRKLNHGYFSLFLILQTLLSSTHLIIVIVTNKDDLHSVIPDLILYSMMIVLSLSGITLVDRIAKNHQILQYVCLMWYGIIFFVNFFIPIYHRDDGRFLPAYTPTLIIATYLFFCIKRLYVALLMGLLVGVVNTALNTWHILYGHSSITWRRILSDILFSVFLNALGLYYRYMNEIVTRHSFLDRRECIMSTHQLRHERNQMEQLMQSILPDYVLNKVKERYLEATRAFLRTGKILVRNPFDASLLDLHENVSILFADIVHYTEMTIQLDITELLETLNDLFTLFDAASMDLKVSRIKFLGDCYYCVAGLPPNAAPNPAEACVDFGLQMIEIISAIKKQRNLNINMRIGVHDGTIIAGTIGAIKYQFDIWSKDVETANKMESEGCAGKVHITNKTKEKLKKHYHIVPTNKGETVPQFKQIGITTFLVSPTQSEIRRCCSEGDICENHLPLPPGRPSVFKKRNETFLKQMQRTTSLSEEETTSKNVPSIEEHRPKYVSLSEDETSASLRYVRDSCDPRKESAVEKLYKKRISSSPSSRSFEGRRSSNSVKRRTAFMNNNIKRYAERTEVVNAEMRNKIEEISFSKYRQYMGYKDIIPLLLFRKCKIEWEYLKIPDPLFKYYLLGSFGLVMHAYLLQNLTLIEWDRATWTFLGTASLILLALLPSSWAQCFYYKYITKHVNELPKNKLALYLCAASKHISNNVFLRLTIFSLVYILFFACVYNELMDCKHSIDDSPARDTRLPLSDFKPRQDVDCVLPWHMTETCIMTVVMSFLFLRIFIWLKLVYGIIVLSFYSYCVIILDKGYYEESETFNYSMPPQVAHILGTVFLTFTLHLVDRQTDYMNRLDYLLNREVKSAQEKANELQKVNEILLLNILPKHVAKVYLDVNREPTDLYYEEHNDAVVMFASIIMDDDLLDVLKDYKFLSLMNIYIHSYDTITNRPEFRSIEKIKIAKWTYMVACGLNPGGRVNDLEKHYTTSNLSTLLGFATEMFKTTKDLNRKLFQDLKLRIGVCHGTIVAGVVGSNKPLYDIWGNPVNMASRMDSTGIPNNIQVLEETAEIIQKLGFVCEYRGSIPVKGRSGLVKTYFVKMDDQFNLVRSLEDP
ncbi:unnamed protein product [Phaedon cochleariae]|uniref:adenylate cyclase n=1 Tax=Phaedon cochleariae TaxID=80249 RepID=A0A9P0GRM9_PHACE|nr:unnamed protein product [Phaedon cochleariae]